MIKIKFSINKKKGKFKKEYFIGLKRRNIKINYSKELRLGGYISSIKSYMFIYSKVIAYSKLGAGLSKRFSLRSLFYLKKFLNKNIS